MATFTRPRGAHVRLPDDFGLGIAVTVVVVALLGLVLLVSLSLPSRGPLAEPPAPGGVVVETPAQSPPLSGAAPTLDHTDRRTDNLRRSASASVSVGCRVGAHPNAKEDHCLMPRYLIQASYTAEAAAAFVSNPQDRVPGVRALAEKLGGKLDSFEFSFGEYDIAILGTFPDDTTAAACALAVNAAGHVKSYKTTRLMSSEDFVAAQQKAHGLNFQAPTKA